MNTFPLLSDEELQEQYEAVQTEFGLYRDVLNALDRLEILTGEDYSAEKSRFEDSVNYRRAVLDELYQAKLERGIVVPTMYFVELSEDRVLATVDSSKFPKEYNPNVFPRRGHIASSDTSQWIFIDAYFTSGWNVEMDDKSRELWSRRPKGFDTRKQQ